MQTESIIDLILRSMPRDPEAAYVVRGIESTRKLAAMGDEALAEHFRQQYRELFLTPAAEPEMDEELMAIHEAEETAFWEAETRRRFREMSPQDWGDLFVKLGAVLRTFRR